MLLYILIVSFFCTVKACYYDFEIESELNDFVDECAKPWRIDNIPNEVSSIPNAGKRVLTLKSATQGCLTTIKEISTSTNQTVVINYYIKKPGDGDVIFFSVEMCGQSKSITPKLTSQLKHETATLQLKIPQNKKCKLILRLIINFKTEIYIDDLSLPNALGTPEECYVVPRTTTTAESTTNEITTTISQDSNTEETTEISSSVTTPEGEVSTTEATTIGFETTNDESVTTEITSSVTTPEDEVITAEATTIGLETTNDESVTTEITSSVTTPEDEVITAEATTIGFETTNEESVATEISSSVTTPEDEVSSTEATTNAPTDGFETTNDEFSTTTDIGSSITTPEDGQSTTGTTFASTTEQEQSTTEITTTISTPFFTETSSSTTLEEEQNTTGGTTSALDDSGTTNRSPETTPTTNDDSSSEPSTFSDVESTSPTQTTELPAGWPEFSNFYIVVIVAVMGALALISAAVTVAILKIARLKSKIRSASRTVTRVSSRKHRNFDSYLQNKQKHWYTVKS